MTPEDIENRFTYHPPLDGQAVKYADVRARARDLALNINSQCPESREKALAITHLEETVFWANAAIARHGG